ncbi:MAG: hypothetical protein ACLTSX_12580 [Collinsella sp.]
MTPNGTWSLRSPLFALCGSGTTGCHNGFHGGARYVPRWVWDNIQYEQQWWDGLLLKLYPPHHPGLYEYGRWEIEDRETGRIITIRKGPDMEIMNCEQYVLAELEAAQKGERGSSRPHRRA